MSTTMYTAIRENDSKRLNEHNDCEHYISKRWQWLKRLRCKHEHIEFQHNLYGDDIIATNGCRSKHECQDCGAIFYKDNYVHTRDQ